MRVAHNKEPQQPQRALRLWPGVVIVALQWLLWFGLPVVVPEATLYGVFGGLLGGLGVVAWWVFLSRAPWSERLGAVALMMVALVATPSILHESMATGMMGMLFVIYAVPVLSLALVAWAVASRGLHGRARLVSMVATIVLASGVFALLRTEGITGDADSDFEWRWTATPEERLLARAGETFDALPSGPPARETPEAPRAMTADGDQPAAPSPDPGRAENSEERLGMPAGDELAAPPVAPDVAESEPAWPGFRGPERNGIVRGLRIETDWSQSPPVELWRRPIGPAWSSFAVDGDLLYTQEQRGEDEIVACYRMTTGEPVWSHRDPARFWESNGGPGPRATPTLSNGRVYAFGATGILNALDARTGAVIWSRNAASDTGTKVPGWGFASSPLVVGDLVIAATAGVLVGYDLDTGEPRWLGPSGGWGYSSPHLAVMDGIPQILLLHGAGAIGVAPADGTVLWEHSWPGDGILQPAVTADGDVLIGTGSGMGAAGNVGIRRIAVAYGPGGWKVDERWTSPGLKPYFNDFVVHEGHAFGFDGSILACIDLEDGKRKWKGGRYGHGQLVLLPDQDLLLVLSEQGELTLVEATPERFTELARVPALEGKSWNHPVLVGDVLLARNGQEMVAFRLALAGS